MSKYTLSRYTQFLLGYALGLITLAGCATAFPWHYFASQMPDSCYEQGKLLGKEGKDGWPDLPLTSCKPDPDSADPKIKPVKLKCITVLVDDFYSLKADDEKCHADLQACQKGPRP